MIGVLGGMGPAATVDFLDKLIAFTDADHDQDHVPVVLLNDPRIPDRSEAIIAGGPTPLPDLIKCIEKLKKFDLDLIVMPCNSAHYWIHDMARQCPIPILSIVDATILEIQASASLHDKIGILSTAGTRFAKIYDKSLSAVGYTVENLSESEQDLYVSQAISLVKAGQIEPARHLIDTAIRRLSALGCTFVVLGCTEISILLGRALRVENVNIIDSNTALAKMTLRQIGQKIRSRI